MRKIVMTQNGYGLEADKTKHLICGGGIGAIGFAIALNWGWELLACWALGLGIALAAGVGKEIYDYTKTENGIAEIMDIVWTVIGGSIFPTIYTLTSK